MPRLLLYISISIFMCQCTTSRITGTWKGTDIHPEHYKNILVLAIIHGPDSSLREIMEKHMVNQLTAHGCRAVSACSYYGQGAFVSLPADSIKKILQRDSINVVLTIDLRDKSREIYDVTEKVLFSLYPFRENDFWMYYAAMNEYHPFYGDYKEHTAWFWKSNIYDVTSGALVYAVQTASFDPLSREDLSSGYARIIVKNIIRNNILQPHKYPGN